MSTTVGWYDPNRVRVMARLAPWSERDRSQQEIMAASARVSFSFFKDDQKYMYTGI